MTEPTFVYLDRPAPPVTMQHPRGCHLCNAGRSREAVAAWEQWTEARSFDEHTAAASRLDAAMLALREVAT